MSPLLLMLASRKEIIITNFVLFLRLRRDNNTWYLVHGKIIISRYLWYIARRVEQ